AGPLPTASQRSGTLPMLSVGVHHQFGPRLRMEADAFGAMSPLRTGSSAGAMSGPNGSEIYGAKLRMEWTPAANTGLGLEHGALNMRFNAGTNMALRVRKGGPMLYVRSRF
ncbi:MAG: hypothetical protein JWP52_490, partial [Rhizobacter sp.]|nr:hypothetical protein [Rhizobacter sp.]